MNFDLLSHWRDIVNGKKGVSHHRAMEIRKALEDRILEDSYPAWSSGELPGRQSELTRDIMVAEFRALCEQYDRSRLLGLTNKTLDRKFADLYGDAQVEHGMDSSEKFLTHVRTKLFQEKDRMFVAEAALNDISKDLETSVTLFQRYRQNLAKSHKAMMQVVRKAESDGRHLRLAWIFFCGVCTYIILKRLLIIRMIYYVRVLTLAHSLSHWHTLSWIHSHGYTVSWIHSRILCYAVDEAS
ncbi:putative transmembrane protein [Gregarina niphandrodes]|uniref:Transmembrane protein n=1 Tax=Gregarina niphandrodes TaxID=110365 RepID=A0A023B190_GRENI|nr:putative transmembrane protein [Gregarina niphandrodes]EZG46464.1 putative transmembrane protein [Gregarina niphandrodes]|eukprot:XP_011132304.1 putative transmembrane protein [Gregarina niphandrodes]